MKSRTLIAALLVVASATVAQAAPDVPAEFAVCVTTIDAGGIARLDGHYADEAEAQARRAEILRDGWITQGDEWDREDQYPAHSIVKATVDPTLINQPSCLPPSGLGRSDQ